MDNSPESLPCRPTPAARFVKNGRNHHSSSLDARFAVAHLRIDRDVILPVHLKVAQSRNAFTPMPSSFSAATIAIAIGLHRPQAMRLR